MNDCNTLIDKVGYNIIIYIIILPTWWLFRPLGWLATSQIACA